MESIYRNDFVNNDYLPTSPNFWEVNIRDIRWSQMLVDQGNPTLRLQYNDSTGIPVFTNKHKALPFSRHDIFYMKSADEIINLRFLDHSYPEVVRLDMMKLAQVAGIKSFTMYKIHLDFSSVYHAIEFVKIMMILEEEFWLKAYNTWINNSSESDISQFMDRFCEKYSKELISRGWFLYEKAILYYILKNKFENPRLKEMLKKTTNKRLLCIAELNDSTTKYLENVLGQIIMFVRSELKNL